MDLEPGRPLSNIHGDGGWIFVEEGEEMKAGHVAAIYGVSVAGAAAISYLRGRQGTEILFDAAFHGALVGTGLAVVGYFVLPDGEVVPVVSNPFLPISFGRSKDFKEGMGSINPKGVKLLAEVPDKLFADQDKGGVKVTMEPDPEKFNIIVQAP